jgi:hypothetical protein
MKRRVNKEKVCDIYKAFISNFEALEYGTKEYTEDIKRMFKIKLIIDKCKNLCIKPGDEFMEAIAQISAFFEIELPDTKKDEDFLKDCNEVFTRSVQNTSCVDFNDMVYFLWAYNVKIDLPINIKVIGIEKGMSARIRTPYESG